MAGKNDSWGIEVGADAIKAIRLQRSGEGITLVDYDVLPFKRILTTPDLNVDEAIQVNMDQLLSRHDFTRSTVMMSVPGHMAFARFAKLPPVDPKKIGDIVRFEAVQQIPFPIDQVEWDYQVFQKPDSPDVEVGIFAITKDRVAQILHNYRAVGLVPDGLTLSPLAVYNAMAYDMQMGDDAPGTIIMDIGTTSTDVVIVEQGNVWLRTLPIGGNNFTEALVRSFKLSYPKADKLKREAGTSKYSKQIFQALRPVFADFVQETQRSLGYYQSLNRDAQITRLVGLGSTFRLPGMQKFLKQQLQIEVIRPDAFRRITAEGTGASEFAGHALNLATAYGCALQGLDASKIAANILPEKLVKQRLWKAKQPWIGGAAALLLLSVGLAGGRYIFESRAYENAKADSIQLSTQVVSRAKELVQQFESAKREDPRMRIENLRRILDYRDVWPKLIADINTAIATYYDPQQGITDANYEKIAAIPRAKRRQVVINSITTNYVYSEGVSGQPRDPNAKPLSADEIWAAGSTVVPPTLEVVIEGTTPLNGAVEELNATIVQWFKENGSREDRPYEIDRNSVVVASIDRISSSQQSGTIIADDESGSGRSVARSRGATTTTMASSLVDVAKLLPPRPLMEESDADDWKFTLRLRAKLLRPEDARRREIVSEQPTATGPSADASVVSDRQSVSTDLEPRS